MSKSGARDRTTRKVRHAPEVMAAGKKLAKKNPEETMSSEKEARKDANKPRSFLISTRAQSVSLLLSGTQEKVSNLLKIQLIPYDSNDDDDDDDDD
ncbi:death-associated protein-like 1 [Arapaima gigas]